MKKVLVTGATGLIGQRLIQLLNEKEYEVHTLGRRPLYNSRGFQHFLWNVDTGEIDIRAFEGVSSVIHLAGAGVAEKSWTAAYKKEITASRINGTRLLYNTIKANGFPIGTFISASAIGIYGDCNDEIIFENHKPGIGFLAGVCKKWEKEAIRFAELGMREVRCRIGIILSERGGALPELTKTFPLAAYFAQPNLYYSWIHLDDVCGIIIHALQHSDLRGAYNVTSPNPLLMKELMHAVCMHYPTRTVLLPAPPFAIKIAMGEMSEMILSSQRCSANRIIESGYNFKYRTVSEALKAIYKK